MRAERERLQKGVEGEGKREKGEGGEKGGEG